MPERIQLKRTKGWRKPEGAIVVSRPSKWGNPFSVGDCFQFCADVKHWHVYDHSGDALLGYYETKASAATQAVRLFRAVLDSGLWSAELARDDLAGRDLCCWCALDQPCHADVLLEIANPVSVGQPKEHQ